MLTRQSLLQGRACPDLRAEVGQSESEMHLPRASAQERCHNNLK
jgi:hypothetical protein